ncbi:MAG: arylesterase [Gammaproteobacteria bacterium]|nr:arylesterase [Gammaproteobacteria bacterium]
MKKHSLKPALAVLLYLSLWQSAVAAMPPTILVMGDSLSAAYGIDSGRGWVSLLARRIDERGHDFRVVNASISGETSEGGLSRLPDALNQYTPALVIIELGANDGLRGINPTVLRSNLERMIKLSQRHDAKVLLTGVQIPANYGEAFRERYYAVYEGVARDTGTPLVPFLLAGVAQVPAYMQPDGLHPTAKAQPMILDNVWPKLKPLIEGVPAP